MIDPLLNASIKHQIDITQYGNYALARMIRVLNKTDSDLIAQLAIALQDLDAESFKVQRLDKLLASVRDVNADAYAAMNGEMATELQAYVEYEGQFQYDLYKSVVPATFSIASVVPEQVYAAAMAQPMQGRLLKSWAFGLETSRLLRIKDTIAIGYTQGKTSGEIVREIRGTKALGYTDGILDASRREVEAVVHTAIGHTAQMTRNRFYDANADILGNLQWVSTLDGRTSHECRVRDSLKYTQEHAPVGHSIPWGSGPGRLHWRCRSTSIGLLKGQRELTGTRSSANGTVDARLSYSEWLRQQSAEMQDEVLGKAKGARYRADGMKDTSYTNDRGLAVSLKGLRERDARMFKQPKGEFTIYDPGYPRVAPDVSTPARAAAVKLEDLIRRDSLETGAAFGKDGKLLVRKTGDADSLEFTLRELSKMQGSTFTHNHPNGGTFSKGDVMQAIRRDLAELRAVAPNYRHIMTAPNGWPTLAGLDLAIDELSSISKNIVDVMIQAGELSAPFGQWESDHQVWILVAKRFGLTYQREAS